MACITYIYKNFRDSTLVVVQQANSIIEEYQEQGFSLTLRQLYYQFVARDLLLNNQQNYNRLGAIINAGRLAGLIDWERIEDRTRNLESSPHWQSPHSILISAQRSFAIDRWLTQSHYVEVWIEKEALIGVIEPVCKRWDVPYFACRGYSSQSEQWRAGERLKDVIASGRKPLILHLGDHDPSGLDMTRDNMMRLSMFAGEHIHVKRLALNMNQIEEHNPPANPTKLTDSRAREYCAEFGSSSWELDALQPRFIEKLIEDNIREVLDQRAWEEAVILENQYKAELGRMAKNYED